MEQGIGHLLGIVIGIFLVYWYISYQHDKRKEEEEKDEQKEQMERKEQVERKEQMEQKEQEPNASAVPVVDMETELLTTKDLVLQTLRKIGCEYSEEEDGTGILFSYQGEHFVIEAPKSSPYIDVLAPWWYELPMDGDLEDFANMQKAVNRVNAWGACSVFYTFSKFSGRC